MFRAGNSSELDCFCMIHFYGARKCPRTKHIRSTNSFWRDSLPISADIHLPLLLPSYSPTPTSLRAFTPCPKWAKTCFICHILIHMEDQSTKLCCCTFPCSNCSSLPTGS